MSNFRRQAADSLASALSSALSLQEEPVVVDENPSDVADYPRVAVSMERFPLTIHSEEELMVDEDGALLMGANADLLGTRIAGPAKVDSKHRLSKIGSFRGFGRIWCGCRYPGKREEMEYSITTLFNQDESALGRLLVPINSPRIGAVELPWKWTAAFFQKEQSWSDEHSFDERLWSWTNFDVEVDVLVLRTSPMIRQIMLDLNAYLVSPGAIEEIEVV